MSDGDAAYRRFDYAGAMRWYRAAAQQNYAIAQFNLGLLFEYGTGVEKDLIEARRWYRLAAEQGDEGAKAALARLDHR